mgnify:FL=1
MNKMLTLTLTAMTLWGCTTMTLAKPTCSGGVDAVKTDAGGYWVYKCPDTKSSVSSGGTKLLAGIDIENDPNVDFFKPHKTPWTVLKFFQHKEDWQIADFNNDGYVDVLYIGGMKAEALSGEALELFAKDHNTTVEELEGNTGIHCGDNECKGVMPLPQLYLSDENGKLAVAEGLIIDNRKSPGMSLAKDILLADYNNDGTIDFFIPDHGLGTDNGVRDSYYLSQPNGTWLESSSTHLSHPNFVIFDHGGAVGDIDGDGDMDVVVTHTGPSSYNTPHRLMCWMNDGKGFLNKRGCGGNFSFAIELGDMDGDGDLDIVQAGLEKSDCKHCNITGVVWNDGRGNFSKHNTTRLPQYGEVYFNVPEVSMADLDNDGDLDIVLSRAGHMYVGTAVSIIENLGNKKFKDRGLIEVRPAPEGYTSNWEGNPWNSFIVMLKFRDFDEDGDMDVYFGGGSNWTNGMVLLNEGDFNFELLKPNDASYLYDRVGPGLKIGN